ncbi:MAG: nicotinate (nicotinamide) nucleotide adenylyltransferase [Rhodoferax sp.]
MAVSGSGGGAPARRLGVFGGAFDPPHRAHLELVRQAVAQLALDVVHVVPTGQAWHKERSSTAAAHRLAMARLAFADAPLVVVDARELRRAGPSYTVDTLRELRHEYGDAAAMFLCLGQDQWQRFGQWRAPDEIARFATICVAARPHEHGNQAPTSFHGHRAQVLNLPPMDISSTRLREACARGESLDALVLPTVARYIAEHHLYQTP